MDRLLWLVVIGAFKLGFGQQALPEIPKLTCDHSSGVVKRGSEVKLYCQSGINDLGSRTKWLVDGEVIESNEQRGYTISVDQSVLTIDSFQSRGTKHNGVYQCVVNGLMSNTMELLKARIKSFDTELKDLEINVTMGNTAVIACSPPASRPDAQTVFEINGDTIDVTGGRYYLLPTGDLQIFDVNRQDAGDYRCVAINPITAKKVPSPRIVKLNVHPAETSPKRGATPNPVSQTGKRVTAVEGDDVVIPCVFNGNPTPTITWERYERDLPVNRTRTTHGNLLIENLTVDDSGTFHCLASNELDEKPATATFVLDIVQKPRVNFKPSDVYAEIGASMTFKCTVSIPVTEMAVAWFFNGTRVVPDENVAIQTPGEYSELTIRSAVLNHTGIYQCFVLHGDAGRDSSYYRAHVQLPQSVTTPLLLTTPVTSLNQIELVSPVIEDPVQVSSTGVRVTWTISSNDDVYSYFIMVKGKSYDEWTARAQDIPKQATYHVINGLTPGSKYRFKVVAVYEGRKLAESGPSRRLRIDPEFLNDYEDISPGSRPDPAVNDVITHAQSHSNQSVSVYTSSSATTATTATTQNTVTPVLCTRRPCRPPPLIMKLENKTRSAGGTIENVCLADDREAQYFWYKNEQPLLTLHGRIEFNMDRTVMRVYDARASDTAIYTCEARNAYGSNYSQAYIMVIDPQSVNFNINTPSPPKESDAIVLSSTTPTTSTREPQDNSREMMPPPMPKVVALSSTVVRIDWIPINEGITVDFYKVQYKMLGRGSSRRWETVDGTIRGTTSYRMSNLTPGRSYKFRLAAVYVNTEHKFSDVTARVKMPAGVKTQQPSANKKPVAPRLLSVTPSGNSTLTMYWEFDGTDAKRYIVQFKRVDDQTNNWNEYVVNIDRDIEMREMRVAIKDLRPDTYYMLRVLAENKAGRSNPSETLKRLVISKAPSNSATLSGGRSKTLHNGTNADKKYLDKSVNKVNIQPAADNEKLYIILGAVLGSMVLILIVLVAICGCKQRQQRRSLLASGRKNNKFADPSKMLYAEQQVKSQVRNGVNHNGPLMYGPPTYGDGHINSNGTLSSVHSSSQREPRMSLNINPLNELDESHHSIPQQREVDENIDYNLMQHYPHYNNSGSRHVPTLPLHHNSQNSLASHPEHTNFSHNSLPHNLPQQHVYPCRAVTPNQFSTFLPSSDHQSSLPRKLPHPHGLRSMNYIQSPMSSISDVNHSGQKKRRKKRSTQNHRDNLNFGPHHSAFDSGREYVTNTDMSSDDGVVVGDDGHYGKALPPPPVLPTYKEVCHDGNGEFEDNN